MKKESAKKMILNEHNPFLAAVTIQWTWLGVVHQHQICHISQPQIENSQKFCWLLLQLPKPSFIPQITSCARKFMANFFAKQNRKLFEQNFKYAYFELKDAKCLFEKISILLLKTATRKSRRSNKERPTSNFGLWKFDAQPIELNWYVLISHFIWLCVCVCSSAYILRQCRLQATRLFSFFANVDGY